MHQDRRERTPIGRGVELALAVCILSAASGVCPLAQADQPGLVVEEVGGASEQAGLQPSDILISWAQETKGGGTTSGELRGPLDIDDVELEWAPRGPVTLSVLRGGQSLTVEIPAVGVWGLRTRPRLEGRELELYRAGEEQIDAGAVEQGLSTWSEGRARARRGGHHERAAWWHVRAAEVAAAHDSWEAARTQYGDAAEEAQRAGAPRWHARVLELLAGVHERTNDPAGAAELYAASLAVRQEVMADSLSVAESLQRIGLAALSRGDLDATTEPLERALEIRRELAPGSRQVASTLVAQGRVAVRRGDLDGAEALFLDALAIQEPLDDGSLNVASILNNLAVVAGTRGRLAAAEDYLRRSLAVRERLAPETQGVASTLTNLGVVARLRGDLKSAQENFERALALETRLAPGTTRVAAMLSNIGTVARDRGDLLTAEESFRRALALRQELAPASVQVAEALASLGGVARDRGDLEQADRYHREALALVERLAPDSPMEADVLTSLAGVALGRGDADEAALHLRSAVEIRESIGAESLLIAEGLDGLGRVALEQGDIETAASFHRRALEIRERDAPDSLLVASSRYVLGEVMRQGGDLTAAAVHLDAAAAIRAQEAPGSLLLASTMHAQGEVALERGALERARSRFERSLEIRQELAPGTADEAETLHALARLDRRLGHASALTRLRQAIDALESQRARLGGSGRTRSRWTARHAVIYQDLVDALVEAGRPEEAFAVVERMRARGFLEVLAQRDLVFSSDLPRDLDRERRLANSHYETVLARLSEPDPDWDPEKRAALAADLREARVRQDEVEVAIRLASSRLASLDSPEPLDLLATQRLLSPGDVLLSYVVGEDESRVFVVEPPPGGLLVVSLEASEEQLRRDVDRFRAFLRDTRDREALRAPAGRLSATLLGPVAESIEGARRLIIVPDGPLHYLPFAALPDPAQDSAYLVEGRPLSSVASATVLGELRSTPGGSGSGPVVAFGDPLYPGSLQPLPATRAEAEAVARVFPERSRLYLGAEAREEAAKSLPRDASIVHFASHALIDERAPLESALALTIPEKVEEGRDNGYLQAWEIIEQIRLDADLVTLSACGSGLGQDLAGEGMLGLTRAFHHAGARSVLASLWSVSDESTADLMGRFYRYLREGRGKDEALRQAQVDLIQGDGSGSSTASAAEARHPFHWGAFVLFGDTLVRPPTKEQASVSTSPTATTATTFDPGSLAR